MPGLGKLNPDQLKEAAMTSCSVLNSMGPRIQWLRSFITADKMYCEYIAPNEEMVREHAMKGGFPATAVNAVSTILDPVTAE